MRVTFVIRQANITIFSFFAFQKLDGRALAVFLHLRRDEKRGGEHVRHYAGRQCRDAVKTPFAREQYQSRDETCQQQHSGKSLDYFDPETNERYIPYVIEPALGADRVALAFLCDAYDEEAVDEKDTRIVLRLHPALAPYKAAVLPLSKKLAEPAQEVYAQLAKDFMVDFDEAGSIGKRYRRQDEIGTPLCITFDFDSVEDHCVTVRDRDTMEQERIPIADLNAYIAKKVAF